MARGRPPSAGKSKPRGSKQPSKVKPSSAKRQKTADPTKVATKTPFVSSLTGKAYFYNEEAEELHVFIRFNAINPDIEVPPSIANFLTSAVKPFSTELHDIVIGPTCIIAIVTLDENEVDKYYKFCRPGKHRIPNTDCFLHASSCYMKEVLTEIYGEVNFSNMSDESDVADSFEVSSSDEEFNPVPPWERGQPSKSNFSSTQPEAMCLVSEPPIATAENAPSLPAANSVSAAAAVAELERSENPPRSALQNNEVTTPLPSQSENNQPAGSIEIDPPSMKEVKQRDQQALRRRARARFTKIDFDKLEVTVPKESFLTVLFRPTNEGESLHKVNPYKLNKALIDLGGHPIHTRNIRDGGLAADFDLKTSSDPLLQITSILGTPVTACLPKVANSCSGVLSGVHWEITDDQISSDLKTEPQLQVLAVKRLAKPGQQSWSVKVTFQGTVLPTRAFLEGRSHKIRPYEYKPLQCFQCGRYSHTARVCRSLPNCWICSERHDAKVCPNKATPKCGNCGGSHPVDSLICPTRSFQVKIAQVKATENVPFKTARNAVSRAAKSYASALKTNHVQQRQATPVTSINFVPNVAHPRPPQQQQPDLTAIFNCLIAILTAAATTKDFAGAIPEVLQLFRNNSPNPELFQLPG